MMDSANWLENGAATTNVPGGLDDVTFDGTKASGTAQLANVASTSFDTLNIVNANAPEVRIVNSNLHIWSGTATNSMTGGELNILSGEVSFGATTFVISGGTLEGTSAGTLSASTAGSTIIIQGAAQTDPNVGAPNLACEASNVGAGTITFQTLNQDFTLAPGCGISVAAGGTLNFNQSSGNIKSTTGATEVGSVITNAGTVNFNTTAAITVDLPFKNTVTTSVLNVNQGALEFTNGASGTNFSITQGAGSINLYAEATLKADANTSINSGILSVYGTGEANLTGNLNVTAGSIVIDPGEAAATFWVQGNVTISGGTLTIGIDRALNVCSSLGASGDITLTSSATLAVDTVSGGGSPTQTFNILQTLGAGTTITDNAPTTWLGDGESYNAAIVNIFFIGGQVGQYYQLTPAGPVAGPGGA